MTIYVIIADLHTDHLKHINPAGHSYGAVISAAASGNRNVKSLVYAAPFAQDAG